MTVTAAFRADRLPILFADYLTTLQGGSRSHVPLPTFADLKSLIPPTSKMSIYYLRRKTLLIPHSLVVAGSGSVDGIATIFGQLDAAFSKGGASSPALRSLLIKCRLEEKLQCTLVGWVLEDNGKPIAFRWRSSRPENFESGKAEYIDGSGASQFLDLRVVDSRPIRREAALAGAVEVALHTAITLHANELKFGSTLQDGFGGGYDIYVYLERKFHLIDNVTFLFFSMWNVANEGCRVSAFPSVVKYSSHGGYVLVRTFLTNPLIVAKQSEKEAVALAAPIYLKDVGSVPDVQLSEIPLTSPYYGIGIVGVNRAGQEEVFSAVLSRTEAEQIQLFVTGHQKDGLHEVKFSAPEWFSNIAAAAWQKFNRPV
jgi:hypothetical protein